MPEDALEGRDHLHAFKWQCATRACVREGVLHCHWCGLSLSEFQAREQVKEAARVAGQESPHG